MRLAWFSPMPPIRSGIATYSAELVAGLRSEHEIDLFVDLTAAAAANPAVRSAHDFVWMHQARPYDLTVYQLGNSSHHDFLWPYVFRYPGLTVLHDAHLHHARAAQLLREQRAGDYRAEFAANEPSVNPDAAELVVAGFDSFLMYSWPFTRLVCTGSRLTLVHSRSMRDQLRESVPGASIEHVRPGHGTLLSPSEAAARGATARQRLGIPADAVLFGAFGGLTPEKRVPQILSAFDAIAPRCPSAWLLLAGPHAEHYDVAADVNRRTAASRVVLREYLESDEVLTDCVAASDVTLNLRWPTAREMSGPWLRCLAAGRASIVLYLHHTRDVPSLDPRTWLNNGADDQQPPIAVAVDILDEDHSLRRAMRRLAQDSTLRDALGTAGRDYWMREHSHQTMTGDYLRLLPAAAAAPAPRGVLPAHLTDEHRSVMTRILDGCGVAVPWSST